MEMRTQRLRTRFAAALLGSVCLAPLAAQAQDATWLLNPATADFNTAANWSPAAVPTGIAFFDTSNTTALSISAGTTIGGWTFNAGASNYSFTNTNPNILTFNGDGIVINGGSATITNNFDLRFSNTSTAGSATITNNNDLGFLNTSTAGSATITNNGDLGFLNTSTAGSATITNNSGGLVFNDTSTGGGARFINNLAGTFNMSSLTSAGMTAGSIEGAGSYVLGAKTLTVGSNNLSTEVSGVISGAGGALTKVGSGTLTLSGTNTYTAGTTVNAGTLSVNGDISASSGVTVNSGGTLGGTGTVSDTVINAGGILAPGNSIGTIAVSGNLTFNSGSTYAVEVSPSAADRTNVSGTATLAGTVAASFAAGNYITKSYTILSAGTRSGTFSALTTTNLPAGFSAALSYAGNDALLDLTMVGFTSPASLPRNQQNVFDAINAAFLNGSALPPGFVTLVGSSDPVNAYGQTAGQPGASVAQPGIIAMDQLINTIFDSAFGGNAPAGGAAGFAQENAYAQKKKPSRDAAEAYAAVTPRDRAAPAFEGRWGVWASAYGGNSRVNGDTSAGTSTTTSRAGGVVAGAGYRATPNLKLGFALGGAGTSFSLDGGFGSGKADMFNAAVYGKYNVGPAYLAGVLSYAWQDTTTDRTVTVSGTDKLHAAFKANALAGRIEAGWRYATPMLGVTPYVAAQTTAFYLPGYSETASSGSDQFALSYAGHTTTATRGELGARFDKAMLVEGGVVTLKAKAAWAHGWNRDRTATATFQQLPGATFTVNGASPGPDAALVSLGAGMAWHNGWSVSGRFGSELSQNARVYAGKGTVRYTW
jgi:autotransporter-associated beta strand protein